MLGYYFGGEGRLREPVAGPDGGEMESGRVVAHGVVSSISWMFVFSRTSKSSYTCPWARLRLRVEGGMVMAD